MTTVARDLFMNYVSLYEKAVMAKEKPNLGNGRNVSTVQLNDNLNIQPDGLPHATFSDTMMLNFLKYWNVKFTSPKEANFAKPGTNTRYLHARFALIDPDTEAFTFSFCGFDLIDCSVYPDTDKIRYVYLMEIAKIPESLSKDALRDSFEKNLAKANPSMGDKVKKGLCAPTEVLFLQPETYLLYRDLMLMKGYSVGQLKPVNVISNYTQQKFFFGLQEDFDKLKKIKPAKKKK